MSPPDLLIIGHVVQDLLPGGGWQLGGAVSYGSLLGRNLGLKTAILTASDPAFPLHDLLPGVEVQRVESAATTQMRNVYPKGGRRQQWVPQRASVIRAADLPEGWRQARIVLLGPVAGEVDVSLATGFSQRSLVGLGAQGCLRSIAADGRVHPVPPNDWDAAAWLAQTSALFLSDEDLPLAEAPLALAEWSALVGILAFTRGYGGADLWAGGEWRRIDAFAADPVELTGAGDTFATAFLVRYAESGDPWDAARFASAAASLVIEAPGVAGVPARQAIEARLAHAGG